jgi:hypothetical protein
MTPTGYAAALLAAVLAAVVGRAVGWREGRKAAYRECCERIAAVTRAAIERRN